MSRTLVRSPDRQRLAVNHWQGAGGSGYAISFAGWVRPASAPGAFPNRHGIMCRVLGGGSAGIGVMMSGWSLQGYYLDTTGTYRQASYATGVSSPGDWMHVGVVWDLTALTKSVSLYFNGALGTSISGSWAGTENYDQYMLLGALYGDGVGYESWDGDIAECASWSAALTAAEFAALGRGASPSHVRPDALERYWPLVRDLTEVVAGTAVTESHSTSVAVHPRLYP